MVRQCILLAGRHTFGDGPVGLACAVIANRAVETAKRLAGPGKQDHATDRTVQPVYGMQKHISGLVRSRFHPRFGATLKAVLVMLGRLRGNP